ncbi:MAG TPA: stage VI sporulation protein D [Bacillales bacterium]|nr:stage VI sporulation protein D [Bacillales bacterium]
MSEKSPDHLRFSIEESLWLENGHDVDEVVSLSLEPDISIIENKHYVSVRGSLRLNGEYRPLSSETLETESAFEDKEDRVLRNQSMRPIDKLREGENGLNELEHRFPVDITIPLSRIDRLDDIYVDVETFDYTVPESNCLRLFADLSIVGMVGEQEAGKEEERSERVERAAMQAEETQARQGEEAEREEEQRTAVASGNAESERQRELESASVAEEREVQRELGGSAERDEAVSERGVQEEAREEGNADAGVYEPFRYEAHREPTDEERAVVDPARDAEAERMPHVEMKSRIEEEGEAHGSEQEAQPDREPVGGEGLVEDESSEDKSESHSAGSREEENALYLTKMMTNEEEAFSRLKMCIIQQGDSLQSIAERYQLPLSQLLRVNGLESETVSEGQILYIPISS